MFLLGRKDKNYWEGDLNAVASASEKRNRRSALAGTGVGCHVAEI